MEIINNSLIWNQNIEITKVTNNQHLNKSPHYGSSEGIWCI